MKPATNTKGFGTLLESSISIEIKLDDLSGGEVVELLEEHLADMYATSRSCIRSRRSFLSKG